MQVPTGVFAHGDMLPADRTSGGADERTPLAVASSATAYAVAVHKHDTATAIVLKRLQIFIVFGRRDLTARPSTSKRLPCITVRLLLRLAAPQRVLGIRAQHLRQDFRIAVACACVVLARARHLGFLARLLSMYGFLRSALRGIARCRGRVLRADAGAHPCGGQEGYGEFVLRFHLRELTDFREGACDGICTKVIARPNTAK